MAKAHPTHLKKVKLTDYLDKKEDEGTIEVELDDGSVMRIPPPELWSDAAMRLAAADDNIGCARLLVGTEVYDKFIDGGGSAATFMGIVAELHGIELGK